MGISFVVSLEIIYSSRPLLIFNFFFLSRFLPLSTSRARELKKRQKRSESLLGIFFVARGSSKSVLLHVAARRGRIAKLEGVDQWESGKMHSTGSHWSTRFSRRAF